MKETAGYSPETWGDEPKNAEASPGQARLDALKGAAINRAGETLRGTLESGRAEQAGHRAIDIAAKNAERSLQLLPPGTRMLGKFVGKRAISALAGAGHDRLAPALDRVSTRLETPQASAQGADPTPWSDEWGESSSDNDWSSRSTDAQTPAADSWGNSPAPMVPEGNDDWGSWDTGASAFESTPSAPAADTSANAEKTSRNPFKRKDKTPPAAPPPASGSYKSLGGDDW